MLLKMSDHFQDEPQNPITPIEAYDPAYWRARAERLRERALDAPAREAAAFKQEAADYERLAEHAVAVLMASEAA